MTDTANAPERIWAWPHGETDWTDIISAFFKNPTWISKKRGVAEYVLAAHCDELVAAAYLDATQVLEDEIDLARIALPQAVPVLSADIRAIKNRTPTKAKVALTARDERMKAEGAREAQAKIARLTEALIDVIMCDHHNFYDGPPPRFVQIARAALQENADE